MAKCASPNKIRVNEVLEMSLIRPCQGHASDEDSNLEVKLNINIQLNLDLMIRLKLTKCEGGEYQQMSVLRLT